MAHSLGSQHAWLFYVVALAVLIIAVIYITKHVFTQTLYASK